MSNNLFLYTEIYGNKRVIVSGCSGIIDYSDDLISMSVGRMRMSISGTNLRIKSITELGADIEGTIKNVSYEY